ncbi:MAG: hypothetical protein LBQ55_03420 [Treponema sp.]|jgi:predicted  nucleic acid-binding Zn-ribbon protein|nr:hypothetical protein [Treponema sp.]
MDDRMKTIGELESGRQEVLDSLNLLLEDLGEALLSRGGAEDTGVPGKTDRAGYRRLLEQINDAAELVRKIEEDAVRLKDLEASIGRGEEELTAVRKGLAAAYRKLGKAVLEGEEYSSLGASFRSQQEVLVPKIQSLEERLENLGGGEEGNVFTWIGKSAQSMVVRGFLARSRESLDRVYEQAGEQFSHAEAALFTGGESAAIAAETGALMLRADALAEKVTGLKAERRKIADALGAEGGPARRRGALEKQIAGLKGELRVLYRNFGEKAEAGAGKKFGGFPLTPEDRLILDRIAAKRKTLKDYEKKLREIKTAMAIDAERAEIEKLTQSIEEQRSRIAAAEKAIAEFSGRIEEAENNIAALKRR